MGQAAFDRPQFSLEQYYAWEEIASERHEFFRGEIYAMAGGSHNHARLIMQVGAEISLGLRGGNGCYAMASEQRIRSEEADLVAYPDVVVVCPEPIFDSRNSDTLVNPTYVVEVLSPSTSNYDRTTKLEAYKLIPSLRGVLIVWQDIVRVDHHIRTDGEWSCRTYLRRTDTIRLNRLEIEINVTEIYQGLDIPESPLELVP